MTPEQIERLKEYVEVTKELSGLSFWEAQRIADLRALLAEWEERGREIFELSKSLAAQDAKTNEFMEGCRDLRTQLEERDREVERSHKAILALTGEIERLKAALALSEQGMLAPIAAKNAQLAEQEHERAEQAEARLAKVVEAATAVLYDDLFPVEDVSLPPLDEIRRRQDRLRAALAAAQPKEEE